MFTTKIYSLLFILTTITQIIYFLINVTLREVKLCKYSTIHARASFRNLLGHQEIQQVVKRCTSIALASKIIKICNSYGFPQKYFVRGKKDKNNIFFLILVYFFPKLYYFTKFQGRVSLLPITTEL